MTYRTCPTCRKARLKGNKILSTVFDDKVLECPLCGDWGILANGYLDWNFIKHTKNKERLKEHEKLAG